MKQLESIKLVQFLLYEQQEFGLEEITGIFGRNGSGKSSALDAVQIALFGANKNLLAFNAQADSGARHQNRTLRSYCLGQYGDDSDQCARTQATTYITLVWRDTETNEPISMGVCIEASTADASDKVLGRYVIRGVELAMSEHLQSVDGQTAPL
ncbi:MAG: AAA family ATPase, partial [Bacillota bacterium]|nr:AAA family ATPase [Bacillota bacterium]